MQYKIYSIIVPTYLVYSEINGKWTFEINQCINTYDDIKKFEDNTNGKILYNY